MGVVTLVESQGSIKGLTAPEETVTFSANSIGKSNILWEDVDEQINSNSCFAREECKIALSAKK